MKKRILFSATALLSALALVGCTGQQLADYQNETPSLDLATYFNGPLEAHGIFQDRSGKVVKRFIVKMEGRWTGNKGVLDEHFTYSDGTKERRVWHLEKLADGRYTGTAGDVEGQAQGQISGNAFNWQYTLKLPVDGKTYSVQFDDWMYLMDDRVMLNRATMSKFGIKLGEVTLSFYKS
ncbi:DUF3833 domain-containing protein [Advenella sp. WQ 585]|uniref:Lipoprotein n=2 Tax=Advenella TaxID=290425 RepID=A0A918JH26_9BURK|nr:MULTISPECIES: DUF3833 domain-containing protein [Advenella]MBK1780020.1 DUF3833 domain-containing protein [Advenella mandrilli]NLY33217.1 DUF3833 domain-containing protein [Alcaligenaceae bacterium]WKU19640.1 DUF3833 domain-containing protein [Advenella alkanexedens]GGW81128.1 lipoprotein [Advenella faeciporci]